MADTYVINSGVRRAKAAELAGRTTITADGQRTETARLPRN